MPRKKQRQAAADSQPMTDRPPRGMSKLALAEWKRIVPVGIKAGLFTEADYRLVEAACEQYALVRRLLKEIEKHPPLEATATGSREHPIFRMLRTERGLYVAQLKALGCAPTSRRAVQTAHDQPGMSDVEDEYFD